jgi:hypothetical protein
MKMIKMMLTQSLRFCTPKSGGQFAGGPTGEFIPIGAPSQGVFRSNPTTGCFLGLPVSSERISTRSGSFMAFAAPLTENRRRFVACLSFHRR